MSYFMLSGWPINGWFVPWDVDAVYSSLSGLVGNIGTIFSVAMVIFAGIMGLTLVVRIIGNLIR